LDSTQKIISAMHEAVPTGRRRLDGASLSVLRDGTRQLLATRRLQARAEYARFREIGQRMLSVPEAALREWIGGKTVLVTGGTGCIGSALVDLLVPLRPRRLASVSRGHTQQWPRARGAEYFHADVRDLPGLTNVFTEVRPDLIFHLAAQRDPGLAQREVRNTVTVNISGAENVLAAATSLSVPEVVLASTGKALRPYSPDVYAATKRAAEWLGWRYTVDTGGRCSAARFTHVVGNSIIHRRLLRASRSGFIRLYGDEVIRHGADVGFYAQSAPESAQLLLCAGLAATGGEFRVHAITDLGWPVSLLDLALGVIDRTGSDAAIYFSGDEPGYESAPFPGLYDPRTAGSISPLISAFEAASTDPSPHSPTGSFPLRFDPNSQAPQLLQALQRACAMTSRTNIIGTYLDELSWALADAAFAVMDHELLMRIIVLTSPYEAGLKDDQLQLFRAIKWHALAKTATSPNGRDREHHLGNRMKYAP
jgi:nucleoside-diphosphate-sugar epimerase